MHRVLALFCMAIAASGGVPLRPQIERILDESPTAARTYWGIHVVDTVSGRTLYEKNADRFFTPASNMKLFTTALALLRLGPDHRFVTTITHDGRDLRLVGGGDPTLSGRDLPYHKGPVTGDPIRAIRDLAVQAKAAGIRVVEGDVVGDDSAWPWEPYPDGWEVDDTVSDDGAPVSALTVNDNRIKVQLWPGVTAGEAVGFVTEPAVPYFFFHNRVRTVLSGTTPVPVQFDREGGSREVVVRGALPAKSAVYTDYVAVDDPALFAAATLRDELARLGVTVRGRAVARHRFPGRAPWPTNTGVEILAKRESAPLVETLRVIDKISQNLYAEMMLRSVAQATRGDGTRKAALEEMTEFLRELGIGKDEYRMEDGSGLSRLTVVTPAMLTTLLRYMYGGKFREQWISLLPVGGEDGTLEHRFEGRPEASRIRAKTGSLSHVAALSGYAVSRSGTTLAFSVIANNYNGPSSDIRAAIDKIALTVVNLE
jgi:D-alanyl-D-alanine carboxypeptidase/D-alanyl-D-alanine-endopeptidase (penicillin-binding protein 4)